MIWLAAYVAFGLSVLYTCWFWAATWQEWAWDDHPHPFLRYVWRRLTSPTHR